MFARKYQLCVHSLVWHKGSTKKEIGSRQVENTLGGGPVELCTRADLLSEDKILEIHSRTSSSELPDRMAHGCSKKGAVPSGYFRRSSHSENTNSVEISSDTIHERSLPSLYIPPNAENLLMKCLEGKTSYKRIERGDTSSISPVKMEDRNCDRKSSKSVLENRTESNLSRARVRKRSVEVEKLLLKNTKET